ncbi:ABC transporter ATP-binding protein [Paenibacillus agricola]|uniref:ABC transporter ATP-binding protein n=1 Tax=Paenibacillus agricola TaxID=2716264 RepID=A0ABX0J6X9_9BACL|nr:ABC transporter ATP-binding protein [Paenibacillus agricola]NHN31892.1 ABC transporter ATP-binding protein [Paenibacillus agricola]
MPIIEMKQIVKIFEDPKRKTNLLAIDHVDLNVEENEFLCILGPSGCGKSTLLNMIAGFEKQTSGDVLMNQKRVDAPGPERGVVFQQPTLMPWLPVWENVSFHLKLEGVAASIRKERAKEYIEMVGLKGFENHYPHELSGGMNQRVGIARALMLNPSVILMDEPFASIDAQTKTDMQEELVKIWEKHKITIIFITHSIDEALILGTKVAVMTRRPGTIRETMSISLPRPRDVTSDAFNRYKRQILDLLKEEGELAKAASRSSS